MKWNIGKSVIVAIAFLINAASNTAYGDLVALWQFDFCSATDSFDGNHGTLKGHPDFSAGHAGVGMALELSGSECVSISNKSNFDITNEITVAAWIRVNKFDRQWQAIVTKGDSAWRLARTSDRETLAFHLDGIVSDNKGVHQNLGVEGNVNVDDGQWHHAVGVYDGQKIYLYMDGILNKSIDASGVVATNSYNVYIGENAEQGERGFNGLIDDVAIFDHALAPEQIDQLHNRGAASFIPENYMTALVRESKTAIKELEPQQAVVLIEKKIAEYQEWRARNIDDARSCDRQLFSDIYVLLARAKDAAGAPALDVIAAYRQSVSQPSNRSDYVPAALLWLFEKMPTEEYVDIVRECLRNSDEPSYHTYHVARHFSSSGNWGAFELFLNTMFSEVNDTITYAKVVAKGLEEDETWTNKFSEYCRNTPELTEYIFHKHEKTAARHIAQQNFGKAAEIYRDIIGQCGPNQPRAAYELKLYECLFNQGQYGSVVQKIDSFVKNNKSAHGALMSKAIMLKGRACVQLGDVDRATRAFFTLMVEHPGTKQAPEASLLVGYLYMLQGEFATATQAFSLLVNDYPESSYADNARSYLMRIKNMTE